MLRQVSEGVLSAADGAVRFGVTERHFRRVRRRFEAEDDGVVVHGLRGSRSNRSLPSGAALEKLGVEVVLANSPQAKGRVERTFGTAQDRLIKEMRLARTATIEAANRYLVEQWMPFRNERFAVAPADRLGFLGRRWRSVQTWRPVPSWTNWQGPRR